MTDTDDIARRKKRRRDEPGMNFRELIGYVDEGPLPPRPHRSGVGGWSTGPDGRPIGPGWPGSGSVWSAADAAANGMTLSNGGLTVALTPAGAIRNSVSKSSGKVYFELVVNSVGIGFPMVGVASSEFVPTGSLGASIYSFGFDVIRSYDYPSAGFAIQPSGNNFAGTSLSVNDVVAVAIDFTAQNIWFAKNNVWLGAFSPNPDTGAYPFVSFVASMVGPLFVAIASNGGTTTWTLQATAASQKYAPPAGFSAWDGGAALTPAQAYLARTVGGNEGGNAANITALINGLVSDGVWAKLDALYVLAQQNQTDALLNLVGTSYSLSNLGLLRTSTFTAYQGFTSTGGSYLDTGFNPSAAPSPHYALNSASFGAWAYNAIASTNSIMLASSGSPSQLFNEYTYTPNIILAYINSGQLNTNPNSPNAAGFFTADRSGVTSAGVFYNGLSQSSDINVSTVIPSVTFIIRGPSGQTTSAAFIGASLGAAGQLALYNRLKTYMDAIGVP